MGCRSATRGKHYLEHCGSFTNAKKQSGHGQLTRGVTMGLCQDKTKRVEAKIQVNVKLPEVAAVLLRSAIIENLNPLGLQNKVWE